MTTPLEFLTRWLPPGPARVLDAGCGRGGLAAALDRLGHRVTAVDIDAEAVAAARAIGVPAIRADLAEFTGGPFDAVVCALSLHHVADLPGTLDRLAALLAPGGTLLVDEFGWEDADRPTATWFYDLAAVLGGAGLLRPGPDRTAPADPLRRWVQRHRDDEPMHPAHTMLRSIAARFSVVEHRRVPYLHRYLGGWLDPAAAPATVAALRAVEDLRVAQGRLRPLGLLLVARSTPTAA
jgi:SAM-dependent methyltransferase